MSTNTDNGITHLSGPDISGVTYLSGSTIVGNYTTSGKLCIASPSSIKPNGDMVKNNNPKRSSINNTNNIDTFFTTYDKFFHNIQLNVANNEKLYMAAQMLQLYSHTFRLFIEDNNNKKHMANDAKLLEYDLARYDKDDILLLLDSVLFRKEIPTEKIKNIASIANYLEISSKYLNIVIPYYSQELLDFAVILLDCPIFMDNDDIVKKIIETLHLLSLSYSIKNYKYYDFFEKIVNMKTDLSSVICRSIHNTFSHLINSKSNDHDIIMNFCVNRYSNPTNYQELVNIFERYSIKINSPCSPFYLLSNITIICIDLEIPDDVIGKVTKGISNMYELKKPLTNTMELVA